MSVLARLFVILLCCSPARAEKMPERFVYLRDVDPSIAQAMLYAGTRNFTGRRVPGYDAGECVLVREAAHALKAVQAELKPRDLGLIVYDCYRPARAVKAFVDWAMQPDDPDAKSVYYPHLSKRDLFPDYIATISGHSRGATIDVALMPLRVGKTPMLSAAQRQDKVAHQARPSTWEPASIASTRGPKRSRPG